jgi:hypothetical protein
MNVWVYSNQTHLGVVLGIGVEAVKNTNIPLTDCSVNPFMKIP